MFTSRLFFAILWLQGGGTVKTRFKELRKELRLTQEEFAAKIDLSRSYINLIEMGKKTPAERTIKDICRTFNVSCNWLMHGEGEMFLPAIDEEMNYVSELLDDVDNPLYEIIKSIMKTYLELDEKQKEMVKSFAKNLK